MLPGRVVAQSDPTTPPELPGVAAPVLVLNQDRLLTDSEAGRRILADENATWQKHEAEGVELEQILEAEERELSELRDTLPLEDFQQRAVAFDEKVVRIRQDFAERSDTLARELDTRRKAFISEVVPFITQIMGERGASLVFEQRGVLISLPQVDITLEVIRRIDNSDGFQ